jgi:glycosyltransferase involved in cell wall biosynthesis
MDLLANELCPCGSGKRYKHCHGSFDLAARSDTSGELAEFPGARRNIVIDWQTSSYFGWGVYGLNLALEFAIRGVELTSIHPIDDKDVVVDALRLRKLSPFIARSNSYAVAGTKPGSAWLHYLGNEFLPPRPFAARIGVIFFEMPLSPEAVARAKEYDLIISGSSWNEAVLRAAGIVNVRTVLQGVDRSLFYPAPKRGLYPDRFLIFSGGKAELRKGQDIAVKAFRIFARRHPEAMLVTAWHSPWPNLSQGMDLSLSEFADQVIDVGALPNGAMAPIYRECDVALFPSRAEGGTNLVAMECLACGIPVILSDNTGHRDLIAMGLGYPLGQRPGKVWSEWGESDVDETVEALESAFSNASKQHMERHELPQWNENALAIERAVDEIYI